MVKLDNFDLGAVRAPQPRRVSRRYVSTWTGDGFVYPQDVAWVERGWQVLGTLANPSAADVETLEGLALNPNPVVLDLDDKVSGFIRWVVVEDVDPEPVGGVLRYGIRMQQVPCVGVMYMQTDDIYLHGLDYRAALKVADPLTGHFSHEWAANRLTQTWQTYMDNDKNAIQTAILEIWGTDDISRLQLWGWKAAAWSAIADWGNADAWNAIKNWTDGDGAAHDFQANKSYRGQALAGIGTISWMLGNLYRVLMEVTNLTADAAPASDMSTHYGGDQLLLKLALTSTSREALRPLPVVTYRTGGLGPDVA